jgi:hypothetical protein
MNSNTTDSNNNATVIGSNSENHDGNGEKVTDSVNIGVTTTSRSEEEGNDEEEDRIVNENRSVNELCTEQSDGYNNKKQKKYHQQQQENRRTPDTMVTTTATSSSLQQQKKNANANSLRQEEEEQVQLIDQNAFSQQLSSTRRQEASNKFQDFLVNFELNYSTIMTKHANVLNELVQDIQIEAEKEKKRDYMFRISRRINYGQYSDLYPALLRSLRLETHFPNWLSSFKHNKSKLEAQQQRELLESINFKSSEVNRIAACNFIEKLLIIEAYVKE